VVKTFSRRAVLALDANWRASTSKVRLLPFFRGLVRQVVMTAEIDAKR
jgi:hypothetical protein